MKLYQPSAIIEDWQGNRAMRYSTKVYKSYLEANGAMPDFIESLRRQADCNTGYRDAIHRDMIITLELAEEQETP